MYNWYSNGQKLGNKNANSLDKIKLTYLDKNTHRQNVSTFCGVKFENYYFH